MSHRAVLRVAVRPEGGARRRPGRTAKSRRDAERHARSRLRVCVGVLRRPARHRAAVHTRARLPPAGPRSAAVLRGPATHGRVSLPRAGRHRRTARPVDDVQRVSGGTLLRVPAGVLASPGGRVARVLAELPRRRRRTPRFGRSVQFGGGRPCPVAFGIRRVPVGRHQSAGVARPQRRADVGGVYRDERDPRHGPDVHLRRRYEPGSDADAAEVHAAPPGGDRRLELGAGGADGSRRRAVAQRLPLPPHGPPSLPRLLRRRPTRPAAPPDVVASAPGGRSDGAQLEFRRRLRVRRLSLLRRNDR